MTPTPEPGSTLRLLWHGMFQGAFKHQVLERGVDDVYYLKRADFQLPVPPLPTVEVAPEVIPDLREVYGIGADGTMYLRGKADAEAMCGDRRVVTLAAVDYGEADEAFVPLDHELGNPFYGSTGLAPNGEILVVSNMPGFAIYDGEGHPRVTRDQLLATPGLFEAPADRPPFWVEGAGDLACGPDGFLVGGFPLNRVDHYGYDGKLRASIRAFEHGGEAFDLERMTVAKVAFGPGGRLIVTTSKHLFMFSEGGACEAAIATKHVDMGGGNPDFHLWIAVDGKHRLWTQYYKGKEVAYAAFELPGVPHQG